MQEQELRGVILDIDYIVRNDKGIVRITFKTKEGAYTLYDKSFHPYFYLVPFSGSLDAKRVMGISLETDNMALVSPIEVKKENRLLNGEEVAAFKVVLDNPKNVPRMSETLGEMGQCYEHDILFWKRYLIDNNLSPMLAMRVRVHEEEGELIVDSISNTGENPDMPLTHISFDIETYNPATVPRYDKDPVIMISYTDGKAAEVLTYKNIDRKFVAVLEDEKSMLSAFVERVNKINPDIVVGYNSSNFDLQYLAKRGSKLKVGFAINRNEGEVRAEHHGLVEAFKIPGRINLDIYNVARFVQIVGAAEQLLKVNSLKLYEIYAAITGKTKNMVDRPNIWKIWDGSDADREELADYSLGDSHSLDELYEFFLPLELEIARVSGTTLAEAAISTTGQLVEYLLMSYAHKNNQIIPNKPKDSAISERLANPFEGAYVIKPEPGIYANIAVFDFRSLYPSIIIAHNIDNSTITTKAAEYFESPNGFKFRKDRKGIMPIILKMLLDERKEVKKAYKKDPDNKALGARSQALKILANSFYGYLGYARSRWYSRECASSVTAFGRSFINMIADEAAKAQFKVLYGDSVVEDSIVRCRLGRNKIKSFRISELFKEMHARSGNGKEYYFPRMLFTETLDSEGKMVLRKVRYVMRHKTSKKVYRVWLTDFLHVDVTEDHSLMGFINLSKSKAKTMDRIVEVKPLEIGGSVKTLVVKKVAVRNKPEDMGFDNRVYELMGFFVGDGSFQYNRDRKCYYLGIAAGNDEKEILEKLILPLNKSGVIRNVVYKGRGDLIINGLDLVRLFEREIRQEGMKRIPESMFEETDPHINAFLRGLFSSDGTVMTRNRKPIIRYTTVDAKLALQIRELLWQVGISSSIFKENKPNAYKGKVSGTYSYHVVIKSKDRFVKNVGFLIDRKNKILSHYKETSLQKKSIRIKDFDISSVKKIEEIDYSGYVYDLEVDDTHRFFADGVLVHNTDSIFLLIGKKTKDDANAFAKHVNSILPNEMELELEDFYTRGVFVGKKGSGEEGAKKKYALLSESGRIKIKGFELVRRDWSKVARDTQKAVLESLLKEGSKDKAAAIVKDIVKKVQEGNMPLSEFVIHTQLRKGIKGYDVKSPELAAAKKAIEKGFKKQEEVEGAVIGYIITKRGNTISEKAELEGMATDYDPAYYIDHQIIPSTLKILKELGFSQDELKGMGSQKKL